MAETLRYAAVMSGPAPPRLMVPGARLASSESPADAPKVGQALTFDAQLAFFCISHGPGGSAGDVTYSVIIDGTAISPTFKMAAGPGFVRSLRLPRTLIFKAGAQIVVSYDAPASVSLPDFAKVALVVF